MRKMDEQVYRALLEPLGDQVKESFISAMVLRMNVHLRLAQENGAEPEDMPAVINQCFTSGAEQILAEMNKLAELDKANVIVGDDQ